MVMNYNAIVMRSAHLPFCFSIEWTMPSYARGTGFEIREKDPRTGLVPYFSSNFQSQD